MKALELIGLAKSVIREDALSTMPIMGKIFKIKTDEIIKIVKQDDAYITYVVKGAEGFGTEEVQVSLNDFEGLLPTEYAVEALEDSDIDELAGNWEDFWASAKKMVPNIKGTSAALAALDNAKKAMQAFFAVASKSVEESKRKNEANKNYDALVDALDVIPTSKAPRGLEAVVDLFAQVYNGGIEQYISNDYLGDLPNATSFLQKVGGSVCREVVSALSKYSQAIHKFDSNQESEDAAEALEPFDDYMYANDRIDKAAGEIVAWLKKEKILAEALSDSDAKQQASQLAQYLKKFTSMEAQKAEADKWFETKDFSPNDFIKIINAFEEISKRDRGLIDASHLIKDEAQVQEAGTITSFELLDLGVHAETPTGVDQKDFQNIIVVSGTSARDAGEEAIDQLSGKDVVVSPELESAVGELPVEDDSGDGFHYVALLFNTEVAEALKRLASSGEKAKFQNLKKQIDALEQEKLKIRDQLAALVGKDEPQKSDALRDRRTAILDKIKKLEDEKRKMHNQFRGLMAK